MDILTHTLSGIAIGTVVSSFSKHGLKDKLKITLMSGFAAVLPDFDAISLWSGFDSTIGNLFNLSLSGKEIYSAKLWYSHHAFMHSAFAGLLITLLIGLVMFAVDYMFKSIKINDFKASFAKNKLVLIGFLLGFLIHLIEDMPTPASSWGGVNFFWPSESYIGGTGDIWWWNNYDIFLIVVAVIFINLLLLLINRFVKFNYKRIAVGVFLLGFVLAFTQIKTRDYDFAYSGNTKDYNKFEEKSKIIQREILGDKLYGIMENFDNKLKIYF